MESRIQSWIFSLCDEVNSYEINHKRPFDLVLHTMQRHVPDVLCRIKQY